jgi:hypothetical protein
MMRSRLEKAGHVGGLSLPTCFFASSSTLSASRSSRSRARIMSTSEPTCHAMYQPSGHDQPSNYHLKNVKVQGKEQWLSYAHLLFSASCSAGTLI